MSAIQMMVDFLIEFMSIINLQVSLFG